jgi:Flp pilus assembly protein TadD
MEAGRFAPAEQRFRAVLALVPDNATALNNLAWVLVKQNKPGSVEHARRATALAPSQPAFMDTLAAALAAGGDLPGAIEWQRKAVAKADSAAAPTYQLGLAKLLLQNGDPVKARTELEALKKLGDKFAGHAEAGALLASIK